MSAHGMGNGGIFRLDGSQIAIGPPIFGPNNLDLNDLGEVVATGVSDDSATSGVYSSTRGFILGAGETSEALGISNTGRIAVSYLTEPLLPPAFHSRTSNYGINDRDDVVFQTGTGTEVYFWDGTDASLVASGGNVGEPKLNNLREIVYEGRDSNGIYQIFLATPIAVPEPSSLLLAGIGLAVGAFVARRRRRNSRSR